MSLKVLRCQQANVNTVRTNYGVHVHWYAEVNISYMHQGMEEMVRDFEKEKRKKERSNKT